MIGNLKDAFKDIEKEIPQKKYNKSSSKVKNKGEFHKNSKNKQKKSQNNNEYARAPYNFIEFPDRVVYRYVSMKDLPKHNEFDKGLKTGYIEYEVKNLNSLFIGDGNEDTFFKIGEEYVIPGSTMRGKVRSNGEVLSFSYPKFVEDRRFFYRGLAGHKALRDEYSKKMEGKSIEEKVRVGFLFKDSDGRYKIKPSKKIKYLQNGKEEEKEFFTIDEFRLKKLLDKKELPEEGKVKWMYKTSPTKVLELENKISEVNKEIRELYEKYEVDEKIRREYGRAYASLTRNNNEESFLNKIKNPEIKEKFKEKFKEWKKKDDEWEKFKKVNQSKGNLCYELNVKATIEVKGGGINKLEINTTENLNEKVVLYNSNYMNGKRKHYIIPQESEESIFIVEDRIIYEYKKELENKKFIMRKNMEKEEKQIREFYDIEDRGKIFFYKEIDNKIVAIGRTPYLRLAYDRSVEEILAENIKGIKNEEIDYIEGIFGFTDKGNLSYKGRVNFSDLKTKDKRENIKTSLILSSPKATSFPLYLKQDENKSKELKTYNNEKAELRGRKFYWQKEIENGSSSGNSGVIKTITPLHDNCTFNGKIYFENLNDDELGLLLLALKYDEGTTDNIGMAKPYGYGQIEVNNIKLVIEDKKASFSDFFFEEDKKREDIDSFKKAFKEEFLKRYGKDNYEILDQIKQYKLSKNPEKGPKEKSYMKLEEFKARKILKGINEI